MSEEAEKQLDKMNERLHQRSFTVSRISSKVRNEIIDFAVNECCDDYGMAIDKIWTFYKTKQQNDEVLNALYDLHERVKALENAKHIEESSKDKVMCDGKTVRRGGKEK